VLKSDAELIAECLQGRESSWEALILRYQRLIYSIPLKEGLSADEAAEVFQTVCLKLLEKLPTLRNREKLSSWLITITTRESWRARAQRRRQSDLHGGESVEARSDDADDITDPAPPADEQLLLLERQLLVREAVASLPERCRQLVAMLFYSKDPISYNEIARRLNMPVSSIGPTRARCLQKLKGLLEGKF
jgi:RNA polymerase sigma factor (sigma-70 family)